MAIYKKNDDNSIDLVSEIQSVEVLVSTREPICDLKANLLDSGCVKTVLEVLNNPVPPVEDVSKPTSSTKETK